MPWTKTRLGDKSFAGLHVWNMLPALLHFKCLFKACLFETVVLKWLLLGAAMCKFSYWLISKTVSLANSLPLVQEERKGRKYFVILEVYSMKVYTLQVYIVQLYTCVILYTSLHPGT